MKPRKVIKEIDAIIAHIDGIVEPLQSAATTLRSAQSGVEKDQAMENTLTALKEAHRLVQQVLKGSKA